ncbi:MAG: transposase [Flavobacteriia bacterium]|nr:transposase [Flavobacteriia bacterium]
MPDKFKNKYRNGTFRLQSWDYSSKGFYFITICTQNREHFFGKIEGGKMVLSEIGKLAEKYWIEIPNQFSFIKLHEFVVMQNHVHGILEIKNDNNMGLNGCGDAINRVSTTIPIGINGGFSGIKNPMFHENISRVIRWYKGRCSFEMRKIHTDFQWQKLFHDHIIRNQQSFENISRYIINNPKNWKEDRFGG